MKKNKVLKVIKYIFLASVAFIGVFPFILVFLTSFKSRVDATAMPPVWFFVPTFKNYIDQFTNINVLNATKNSVIIAISATLISIFIGVFTGYIISRFRSRGLGILSQSTLWLRIIPPISIIIPYFVIWHIVGLMDTYFALIVMYIIIVMPLATWMMISFFKEIPMGIEEAAMVDGCNRIQAIRFVIIPMVIPGIFAASALSFIVLWNEFLFAVFISGENSRTLPVELYNSLGIFELDWGRLSTITVFSIIPAIIFISLTQKYIVRGLTMGAIKE